MSRKKQTRLQPQRNQHRKKEPHWFAMIVLAAVMDGIVQAIVNHFDTICTIVEREIAQIKWLKNGVNKDPPSMLITLVIAGVICLFLAYRLIILLNLTRIVIVLVLPILVVLGFMITVLHPLELSFNYLATPQPAKSRKK